MADQNEKHKRNIVLKIKRTKKYMRLNMPKPTQVETPKNVYNRHEFRKRAMEEIEENF